MLQNKWPVLFKMPWSQKREKMKNRSGLKEIKEIWQVNAVSDSQVDLEWEKKIFFSYYKGHYGDNYESD